MKTAQRVLATGLVVAATAAGITANASTKSAGGPVVKFATPVVVDFFHPGYEPDLATVPVGQYKGSTFVSVPNGFSTTMSYIWRSDDNRRSFHMVEGNAIGKSTTCVGGGDSELQVDPVNGAVYFNDLQGLTNFTNSRSNDAGHTWQTSCASVNGAGVDRQWLAIDSNGGKSAVGTGAGDGRLYFDYDNVAQDSGPNGIGGNQLVMNESQDGVHYGAECQGANGPAGGGVTVGPQSVCALPPAVISYDEGIPGNVIVDDVKGHKYQHRVYAIHTSSNGDAVIVSWCSGKKGDNTAASVANNCTDPTQVAVGDRDRKNVNWHDSYARAKGTWQTGQLFPAIRMDAAGNLYAVWSEYPGKGAPTGPGAIKMSVSRDGAQHWSNPITVSPSYLSNNVMPWIIAGSAGRVGVAWYGSAAARNSKGQYGPDAVTANGSWNVYYAMTTNALSSHPSFGVTKVSDHPVKYGDISTGGLGGSHDRSLGDYMQVQLGLHGEAVITYVDDTSNDRNTDTCGTITGDPDTCSNANGGTPAEAAGPVMVSVQSAGASMFAGKNVPSIPSYVGAVRNAPGDAFLAAGGQDVAAPKSLDVVGASIKKKDAHNVTITLTTNDPNLASDLVSAPPVGGAVNTWTVRWAAPDYKGLGDGNMFYVGMESNGSGASYYTGTTQAITSTHTKYFTYPATTKINGTIQGATIIWTLPLSAVGSPKPGQGMFSVTGFTSTQVAPAAPATAKVPNQGGEIGDPNIPNLISATTPFTYIVH